MEHNGKIYHIVKPDLKTNLGCFTIDAIDIGTDELNKAIAELVLSDRNLSYLFHDPSIDVDLALTRFIPFLDAKGNLDLHEAINDEMRRHTGFYSFLGECLLAIFMRDVYGYDLSTAVISTNESPYFQKQGGDNCLYDSKKNVIMLGEAKFRSKLSDCVNDIRNDFVSADGILSKLDNLYRSSYANPASKKILISSYESGDITEIDFKNFLSHTICFSGFALHDSLKNTSVYSTDQFYKKHFASVQCSDIEAHVFNKAHLKSMPNYHIYLFNLPVTNKKELIFSVIMFAIEKRKALHK